MSIERHDSYTVTYMQNAIVLDGACDAIHQQATIILKRFAFSPRSFVIATDTNEHIVLKPKL